MKTIKLNLFTKTPNNVEKCKPIFSTREGKFSENSSIPKKHSREKG